MNNFEKIQTLIKTCKSENIQIAFQLAKSHNIPEDEVINPWKKLIMFFLKENLVRIEMSNIEILSSILESESVCFYSDNIIHLPEKIGALKNLTYLEIQQNELKELPKSITSLVDLEEIFLWNNKIENLPEHFDKLINLKKLTLSYNRISKLPQSIIRLQKLENLLLYENPISETDINILQKALPNCKIEI